MSLTDLQALTSHVVPVTDGLLDLGVAQHRFNKLRAYFATLLVGTTVAAIGGVISVNVTPVGNTADAGPDDLMSYALKAGLLGTDGDSIRIKVMLTTAANANNKSWTFVFGSQTTSIGGPVAMNAGVIGCFIDVVRLSATTQEITVSNVDASGNNGVERRTAGTQDLRLPVTLKMQATSGSSAANDIVQRLMRIEYLPAPAAD